MKRVVHEARLFFIALQFLTRLPVPRWVGYRAEWLHASARHFPAVGLLVGGVGAVVLVAASQVFPPVVAVVLSMMSTVALTGAFHEDGLADTCDGLGGHADRARALAIMKDSRLGTYGAAGLGLVLGLKAAVLVSLPPALALPALLFGHALSRAMAVTVIRVLPYAGDLDAAKARPLAERISRRGLLVALGWVLLTALALAAHRPAWSMPLALSFLCALVGARWCAGCWRRRLGGFTGDTLGATQQVTEVLVLSGWLAWMRFA